MSYKEIQVPSKVIEDVYQEALEYLKPLVERSINKVKEHGDAKTAFEKQEEETYEALVQALKEVLPQWGLWGSADGCNFTAYGPRKPDHVQYFMYEYSWLRERNLVIEHYKTCESMLQGASLSEELTLTEDQVSDFKFYQEKSYKEHVEKWLNTSHEFVSQYDEAEIHKIVSFVQKKKATQKPVNKNEVIMKAQDHSKDYNPSDFWKAFFFIASALLVVIGIVKCS